MKKTELEHIKDKGHPFQVPNGYFDELERSILMTTIEASEPEEKDMSMSHRLPSWSWAAAAAFIVGLAAVLLLQKAEPAYTSDDLLAGITDDEIVIYLATYELTEYEIVGDLSAEQIDELFQEETVLDGLEVEEEDLEDLILEYEALDETVDI